MRPPRRRLAGSRVLCLSRGQVLLVEHHDPATGRLFWVLPGGGREADETFAEAATREVWEETGVAVRLIRRLRVPREQPHVTYALYLAEPLAHTPAVPRVDVQVEAFLRGAAWHPVTIANPLGPLNEEYWGYLARRIRDRLRAIDRAPSPRQ